MVQPVQLVSMKPVLGVMSSPGLMTLTLKYYFIHSFPQVWSSARCSPLIS